MGVGHLHLEQTSSQGQTADGKRLSVHTPLQLSWGGGGCHYILHSFWLDFFTKFMFICGYPDMTTMVMSAISFERLEKMHPLSIISISTNKGNLLVFCLYRLF